MKIEAKPLEEKGLGGGGEILGAKRLVTVLGWTPSITIFSDSQSAVGILSLGWSNSSHKKTAEDIRRLISDLEKSGLEVSIKWTPGHADIRGNCIADELAKEAAEVAKLFPEDSQVLTGADFKKFARVIAPDKD